MSTRPLHNLGSRHRGWPGGKLTVMLWGPELTEPEQLRASYQFPAAAAHLSDAELQTVIDAAKAWIGGRRLSWTLVAANYLADGRYHP